MIEKLVPLANISFTNMTSDGVGIRDNADGVIPRRSAVEETLNLYLRLGWASDKFGLREAMTETALNPYTFSRIRVFAE